MIAVTVIEEVELLVGPVQEIARQKCGKIVLGRKVTCAEETPIFSVTWARPEARSGLKRVSSTVSEVSSLGPVAGVKGTEHCSFG